MVECAFTGHLKIHSRHWERGSRQRLLEPLLSAKPYKIRNRPKQGLGVDLQLFPLLRRRAQRVISHHAKYEEDVHRKRQRLEIVLSGWRWLHQGHSNANFENKQKRIHPRKRLCRRRIQKRAGSQVWRWCYSIRKTSSGLVPLRRRCRKSEARTAKCIYLFRHRRRNL